MHSVNIPTEFNPMKRVNFFMKFLESPTQIGSIIPSSRYLAQKMLEPVKWDNVRFIAELGAGTGVFTRHIQLNKHPHCKVAVFEKDDEMRKELISMYPELTYFKDALHLSKKSRSIAEEQFDAVISGLPFALFEEEVREHIINEVVNSLKPDGIFVTFQYSLQMKKMLQSKFHRVDISFVPINIPPAFVYVCSN